MREVDATEAVLNKGLKGCAHGRPGSKRQVLLMDVETLDAFGIPPGAVKENITTRGLDVRRLQRGQRLRIGEALLEVTLPCEPCGRMDDIRGGLQAELRGKRGKLCRIVESGIIRRGDPIEVLEAAAEAESQSEAPASPRRLQPSPGDHA
jgi:MOSC domain-containing protein YiiM